LNSAGRFRFMKPQAYQISPINFATLPLPDHKPQPASGPLLKALQHGRCFALAEVADPAP
jgi:hypothetical protein